MVRLHADLPWLAADPTRAQAIHASGAHTLLITPMTLRGAVLGLISLYLIGEADPYDEDDIALALDLANHTALCIDNARRYTREHTIATTLERRLLPDRAVPQTALGTAGMPIPSEGAVGWYDTIALPGARTALVVGEIAGQGIHVTAAVGQLRTVVRSLAAFDLEPDELIARLDDTATLLAAERASLPSGDSSITKYSRPPVHMPSTTPWPSPARPPVPAARPSPSPSPTGPPGSLTSRPVHNWVPSTGHRSPQTPSRFPKAAYWPWRAPRP